LDHFVDLLNVMTGLEQNAETAFVPTSVIVLSV
jgi:hypothetical protein